MIDQALTVVRDALRQFIRLKLQVEMIEEKVVLTSLIDQAGQSTMPNNGLGLALYRIVEDRVSESEYRSTLTDSEFEQIRPPVIISLEFLVAANFTDYSESLKYISTALAFFQSQNYFDQTSNPDMPADMAPFSVSLYTQNVSEHNHTWSLFGGRYMPSVMYRLRSIDIQEQQIQRIDTPVENIDLELSVGEPAMSERVNGD
ncbi:DUF4255 domain-containing protein [Pseudoalteromonas sp. S16_S37]|uniref:DUF4255 domain-containing protein n=1 Tax=Pseudoalteromonas sp. S16_S37 TaxID=2720228 RepID=UPI001680858B|nr:DUF4255 domain-containing protein [Pseudoalteromonas sp. S16_S37]MBD1580863.1 DUF4255 domain-containing protein [Pseudoalteromonas sp. S16_S37]